MVVILEKIKFIRSQYTKIMTPKNSNVQKEWYVVYTRSRAEKKVARELELKDIEVFLPIHKQLRKWKDRKKWIETPLITGYCFVHVSRKEYFEVLQTMNVVCYITFEGKAAPVPQYQIDYLKKLTQQSDFEVTVTQENFKPGQKVEVISGPLVGIKGELIESRGKQRFVLRFEQINSYISVEIPASDLSHLPDNKK